MRAVISKWVPGLALLLLALAGCAEEMKLEVAERKTTSYDMDSASVPAATAAAPAEMKAAFHNQDSTKSPARGAIGEGSVPPAVARKIIYNAQVTLVVDSVAQVADEIARLVKTHDGYVSETDQRSYSRQQRQAMWKIRVPVERFDSFVAAVGKLGEMQQNHIDSQDVTQEYYDLEARIKNKLQEEKRLQKHLDESTGKLEDILSVEREITRVRGEVEQMQGRIRYLANVTSLSTVTITASEIKDYVPPVAPTFHTQIGRTFQRSVKNLTTFGKNLVLIVVALAPWLPVVFLIAAPLWLIARRRRAARRPPTAN